MAKQISALKITGTIGDITFYRMEGQYYARRKSSLEGKRVKRDPRFARTMQSAQRLGRGSQLASKVYRSLPRKEQVYALYKELKSLAIRELKEGKSEEAVLKGLQQRLGLKTGPVASAPAKPKKPSFVRPSFTPPLFWVGRGEPLRWKPRGKKTASKPPLATPMNAKGSWNGPFLVPCTTSPCYVYLHRYRLL